MTYPHAWHAGSNPARISALLLSAQIAFWLLSPLTGTARADDASDPGTLQFKKSCGTCHTTDPQAPLRQGPNLHHVVGRPAGSMKGFKYSPAFVKAAPNITWTAEMIDKWITDPQQVIPGAVMLYHQSDPEKRQLIISYLKTH